MKRSKLGRDIAVAGAFAAMLAGAVSGTAPVWASAPSVITEEAKLRASDGPGAGGFSHAVAISGDTAIVGAPYEGSRSDPSLAGAGAAHIYVRSDSGWVHQQRLVPFDRSTEANFGYSVALSGDTAVIGAYRDDATGASDAGSAYVFVRSGDTWVEQQKLVASDAAARALFGYAVGVHDDTAIVGAPRSEIGGDAEAGSAYVFVRSGSSWAEQQTLGAREGAGNDGFGYSVAIDMAGAVVGAPRADTAAGTDAGSAHLFNLSEGKWIERLALTAAGGEAYASFGHALAMEAATVLVGAPRHGDSDHGSAYAFEFDSTDWASVEERRLTPTEATSYFGWSLSLSQDTAVVGSYNNSSAFVFVSADGAWAQQQWLRGSLPRSSDPEHFGWAVGVSGDSVLVGSLRRHVVYAFARFEQTWTEEQKIVGPNGTGGDRLGQSLALSGDTAVLGAPGADPLAGTRTGAVYVHVRDAGGWIEQQTLTPADGAAGGAFGASVALSGDTLIATAPGANAAYAFVRSEGKWTEQQKITASDGGPGFGAEVSLDGDTALIAGGGAAYVFTRSDGSWTEEQKIVAPSTDRPYIFAWSIALSGDTALLGSYRESAYVFVRQGEAWVEQQKLTASDGLTDDFFGYSVALSGDTAFVSAPEEDTGATDSGAVYVFQRSEGSWTEQQKVFPSDAAPYDYFGYAMAINGDRSLVSARGDDTAAGADTGSAYVLARFDETWAEEYKLLASAETAGDDFATSVAISADRAVIGARLADTLTGRDSGIAYAYGLPHLNRPPSINLAGADTSDEGGTHTYSYTASDPEGDALTATESCGAGGVLVDTPAENSFECRFPDGPASTTVSVTVSDGQRATSDSLAVAIANVTPTANAGGPYAGVWGQPIEFDGGMTSDPAGELDELSYEWDFDYGFAFEPTGSGVSPSHTYASPGTYVVALRASDEDAASGPIATAEVTVDRRASDLEFHAGSASAAQYTDAAHLSARVSDELTGEGLADRGVMFTLGSQSVAATTDATGMASAVLRIDQQAGTPGVSVEFADGDPLYAPALADAAFEIHREDAHVEYTGETIAPIGATIELRATVWDSAASSYPDGGSDDTIGDVTKMWIAFDVYSGTGCSNLVETRYAPVVDGKIDGDGIGVAREAATSRQQGDYCVTPRLLDSSAAGSSAWYRAAPAQQTAVVFYEDTDQRVTASGAVDEPAGGTGKLRVNAGYDKTSGAKGVAVYVYGGLYNGEEVEYRIRLKGLRALMFSGGSRPVTATVEGRCSVRAVRTSDGTELYWDDTASCRVSATDTGANPAPGRDTFSLTVRDEDGIVYKAVPKRVITEGNVVIQV